MLYLSLFLRRAGGSDSKAASVLGNCIIYGGAEKNKVITNIILKIYTVVKNYKKMVEKLLIFLRFFLLKNVDFEVRILSELDEK